MLLVGMKELEENGKDDENREDDNSTMRMKRMTNLTQRAAFGKEASVT